MRAETAKPRMKAKEVRGGMAVRLTRRLPEVRCYLQISVCKMRARGVIWLTVKPEEKYSRSGCADRGLQPSKLVIRLRFGISSGPSPVPIRGFSHCVERNC